MNNFDLRKYLAEGKLNEKSSIDDMKTSIKQFIEKTGYTEIETGTEEWMEMVAHVIDFTGDITDLLDMDVDQNQFNAEDAIGILDSLNVEVL
jgi:hypothetical protein|tara:strand:+ start:29 stop:304 length:276 start_codon:yes stop_codon:yes gene_type:complete